MIPLWVPYGFGAVLVSTAVPLIQEKLKANSFALAFWNKVFTATLMLPFVFVHGLPGKPVYYAALALSAALWAIADVLYFRALPVVGAGVVSRLLPSATIITFLLWFLFDPALFDKYLIDKTKSLMITGVILASSYFAFRLKKCEVSMQAVRMVWFVIFAASIGPIVNKILIGTVPTSQGVFAFVFIQALIMITFWSVFYTIRKPVERSVLFSKQSIKPGLVVGMLSGSGVAMKTFALLNVEHPAYLSVVLFMDAVLILGYHRFTGRKDKSDILSGLGIVACAVALVILKSR